MFLKKPELPVIKQDVKIKYIREHPTNVELIIGVNYVRTNSHFLILEFDKHIRFIKLDIIESLDIYTS